MPSHSLTIELINLTVQSMLLMPAVGAQPICYQLPATTDTNMEDVVIVVILQVSLLIYSQVQQLSSVSIPAMELTSNMVAADNRTIFILTKKNPKIALICLILLEILSASLLKQRLYSASSIV